MFTRSDLTLAVFVIGSVWMPTVGCGGKQPPIEGCDSCRDGCSAAVCTLDCEKESCNDRVIRCPQGMPCDLRCNGLDACDTTTVECPDAESCTVQCEGKDACGDMILRCTSSDCSISCGSHKAACEGAVVHCGSGECAAACEGSSTPKMNGCDTSTTCTEC